MSSTGRLLAIFRILYSIEHFKSSALEFFIAIEHFEISALCNICLIFAKNK